MMDELVNTCNVLVDHVRKLEEEMEEGEVLMVGLTAVEALLIVPILMYGANQTAFHARNVEGVDWDHLTSGLDDVCEVARKLVQTISDAVTANDPFKTFNLHAELADAGVQVPVRVAEDGEPIE